MSVAGTNLIDAQETVEALVADAARLPEPSGLALEDAMRQQGMQVLRFCIAAKAASPYQARAAEQSSS